MPMGIDFIDEFGFLECRYIIYANYVPCTGDQVRLSEIGDREREDAADGSRVAYRNRRFGGRCRFGENLSGIVRRR